MTTELKPRPFCGSDKVFRSLNLLTDVTMVNCDNCEARAPTKTWGMRHEPEILDQCLGVVGKDTNGNSFVSAIGDTEQECLVHMLATPEDLESNGLKIVKVKIVRVE